LLESMKKKKFQLLKDNIDVFVVFPHFDAQAGTMT
jgi:hypothetical protein